MDGSNVLIPSVWIFFRVFKNHLVYHSSMAKTPPWLPGDPGPKNSTIRYLVRD